MRCIATLLALLMLPISAFAHNIGADVKLVDNQVVLSAYYDDDTPAGMAKVIVRDAEGRSVLEGMTDDTGVWKFPTPKPGKYQATVDPNDGHLAKISFTIPEPTTAGETPAAAVTDGPSRENFTRRPWEYIAIGLCVIGFGTLMLSRRARPEPTSTPSE